jgi:hypothetical protein
MKAAKGAMVTFGRRSICYILYVRNATILNVHSWGVQETLKSSSMRFFTSIEA